MRRLATPLALAGVLAAIVGLPDRAAAQAGYYLIPSLSLSESYEDNVFGTRSDRKSDFVTRIFPGLTAGYRSEPLTLLGRYVFGAELYADNSDLNGVNNHLVALDVGYLPTRFLTLKLSGAYSQSESSNPFVPAPAGTQPVPEPGALPPAPSTEPPVPGVNVGRQRTTQIVVAPSMSYALTARTSAEAGYTYTDLDVSGGERTVSHDVNLALAYQATPLDRVGAHYRPRYFESEGDSTRSHAVTLEYQRQLTPSASAALEIGPRVTDGSVDLEASATLTYRFQQAAVALGYSRTEGAISGRAGAQTEDSVYASFDMQLSTALAMHLRGSVLRTDPVDKRSAAGVTVVYAAGGSLTYRITEWLVGRAGYQFSLQDESPGQIINNIVVIGIDFYYPIRLY
jgi:hypothetical protein